MSVWILPDHLADILPKQARHIEALRRTLLDTAAAYGYELVMPPSLEYLQSLLTGTGSALNLQTFKLVDQLSGRSMGLRADTTPQVARIDAHLLGRSGVSRLSYCGSVFHTKPSKPHATREPLQLGAELYGYAGVAAEIEIVQLALDCLKTAGAQNLTLDMGDVGVVDAIMDMAGLADDAQAALHNALQAKDQSTLADLLAAVPQPARSLLASVAGAFGQPEAVLSQLQADFAAHPVLLARLAQLRSLVASVQMAHPDVQLLVDMADNQGWRYYTGLRFTVYAAQAGQAKATGQSTGLDILRGGRYDGVGAVFDQGSRPAVGFSLDIKELLGAVAQPTARTAIQAQWQADPAWHAAVAALRAAGQTVICQLPDDLAADSNGHTDFCCDRQLALQGGAWQVIPL
jgi:ATP phosphoribosyltransferase regulatory subunit